MHRGGSGFIPLLMRTPRWVQRVAHTDQLPVDVYKRDLR